MSASDHVTATIAEPVEKEEIGTRRLPRYNVIIENDEYHSFEFVVDVLQKALHCTLESAFQLTEQAHTEGRAIVWSGSKEVAELKAEQIQSFHEIHRSGRQLGPLTVYIEPS